MESKLFRDRDSAGLETETLKNLSRAEDSIIERLRSVNMADGKVQAMSGNFYLRSENFTPSNLPLYLNNSNANFE
jgi:hypothetical protein